MAIMEPPRTPEFKNQPHYSRYLQWLPIKFEVQIQGHSFEDA